ncbi:MAG: hypothetical protein J2P21_26635 [Chloracidobacterium sp.]|nr:hypothetical protein [Chloracidobacterium sp.]
MHSVAKQPNIPTQLADKLINSLSGMTAIGGDELRRQVVMMLIEHSYSLGYTAGADAGLVAPMRPRFAFGWQDIKLALAATRERLTLVIRDHGRRSHFQQSASSSARPRVSNNDRRFHQKFPQRCADVRPNVASSF